MSITLQTEFNLPQIDFNRGAGPRLNSIPLFSKYNLLRIEFNLGPGPSRGIKFPEMKFNLPQHLGSGGRLNLCGNLGSWFGWEGLNSIPRGG